MLENLTEYDAELKEIILEENRPTKKIDKPQNFNKENLLNNEEQIINVNYNLIIKNVEWSSNIEIDDYILFILKKAQKQQSSHFLLIQACEKNHFTNNQKNVYIFLFDFYCNLRYIKQGMQIRVNGEFIRSNTIIFTQKQNDNSSFTLEPETLVAPSTFSGQTFCKRKQYIKEFFQNQFFGTTIEMLGGTIIHEFFQKIIKDPYSFQQLFDSIEMLDQLQQDLDSIVLENLPESFLKPIQELYSKFLEEFYHLEKKTVKEMIVFILPGCVNSLKWINQYFLKKQPIQYKEKYGRVVYEIYIQRWINNEQKISSSVYGLKGFIDLVVEIKFRKNHEEFQVCYAPIELKTGGKQDYYEKQVQIYLLLMNGYYKQQSQVGLLLYLNVLDQVVVTSNQLEINQIFFNRNMYISEIYRFEKSQKCYNYLPDLKDEVYNERFIKKCLKCDIRSVCYGLHILTEQSELTYKDSYYDQVNQQLQTKSKEYLNEMLKNLRQEEQTTLIPQVIYSIKATYNYQTGTQIILQSKIYYLKQQANEMLKQCFQDKTKISLFCIRTQLNQIYTLENAQLVKGTQIINLIENQTDPEDNDFDDQSFDFAIRLQIFIENDPLNESTTPLQINDELIHKQYLKNPFKHYKYIIFELTTNKEFCQRKKEILVFGMEPKFKPITELDDNQKCAFAILQEKFQSNLNEYQMKAIQLCLLSEDFALISGNYGKRKMLSHLLFLLGYTNKKVIFYAVDNEVLEEQIQDFKNTFPNESEWILKLSNEKDKNQDNQQQNSFDFKNFKDLKAIDKILQNKHFYFSTCSNCTDILQSEPFDYCIIDQSTKIIEPQCISCILKSKVFILLQDSQHHQPLVKSQKAKSLKTSLFQRLSQQFKDIQCLQELQFSIQDIEELI